MEVGKVDVDMVQVGPRHRKINSAKLAELTESMQAIGLQQPISIYSPNNETLELVAGLHRLKAAKKLGWEEIDCIFVDLDEIDRELWEIDENLRRADLSPAEEAEHLKRRKTLWEARQNNNGTTCPENAGPGRPIGFANSTAKATGEAKRSVNRKIARADSIAPDVLGKIQDTDLDKGTYLDKLKKLTHEEQRSRVDKDLAAIEQRKRDKALKEKEKQRKEAEKEERRRDFADMGDLLDKRLSAKECEWFLNTLSKYAAKTANDLRGWANL